ncbi:MAG: hypothetical protein V4475_15560 [Pseudomonadota bacterium]
MKRAMICGALIISGFGIAALGGAIGNAQPAPMPQATPTYEEGAACQAPAVGWLKDGEAKCGTSGIGTDGRPLYALYVCHGGVMTHGTPVQNQCPSS